MEEPDPDFSLPELPMSRECPHAPPVGYEQLRARGPVARVRLFDGRVVWAVTGHTAARQLLADPRLSVDPDAGELPKLSRAQVLGRPDRHRAMRTLLRTDPPLHTRQRRAMLPSLTLKRVQARRATLQAVADAHLDELAGRPEADAELIGAYIRPVVTAGLAAMLGVPESHQDRLEGALRHLDPVPPLERFLLSLLRIKRDQPGDGLLDDLLASVDDGSVTEEEFVHYGTVLVSAGQDITVSTIAVGVLTLLSHEDELAGLRAGREPWPHAIEELLRFLSLTAGLVRVATADIDTAGVVIRSGDGVVLLNSAANRDPALAERPHELDLGRQVRNHLTFGFGVHQCIGQSLARLEVEVALRSLVDRFPTLRLAVPADQVPLRQGLVFGVNALPVAW
nr:cytochrome P450 [Kibdelosporangium sp. MJ126-NF4]CEL20853.1 putative cytochrome P450 hydroxylase [Kibdelosporangium sp. MJ126-NF4]CTQ98342.1 putative cytochrome P450 hydroxylase [Kibdelosporangium sp. MJ126-NF4]